MVGVSGLLFIFSSGGVQGVVGDLVCAKSKLPKRILLLKAWDWDLGV